MDEPSPPRPPVPDPQPDPQPHPAPDSTGVPAPPRRRDDHIQARLQQLIETNDPIIAWAQGWVSRENWIPERLAARTLDFAVLTTHSLFLVTTGFFTRRPRRCVYSARLTDLVAARAIVPNGRRLRITADQGVTLRIELRATERGKMFAAAVVVATSPVAP
jgi:hypothetical protein